MFGCSWVGNGRTDASRVRLYMGTTFYDNALGKHPVKLRHLLKTLRKRLAQSLRKKDTACVSSIVGTGDGFFI